MQPRLEDAITQTSFAELVGEVFDRWPGTSLWDGAANLLDEFVPFTTTEFRDAIKVWFVLGKNAPKPGEVIAHMRDARGVEHSVRIIPDDCPGHVWAVRDWTEDATHRVLARCARCGFEDRRRLVPASEVE